MNADKLLGWDLLQVLGVARSCRISQNTSTAILSRTIATKMGVEQS